MYVADSSCSLGFRCGASFYSLVLGIPVSQDANNSRLKQAAATGNGMRLLSKSPLNEGIIAKTD